MKKYAYKVATIATKMAMTAKQMEETAETFEKELNRLGADGWELVQRKDAMFFFKREIECG